MGKFGWGKDPDNIPSQTGHRSVSQLDVLGQPLSGPEGYHGGTDRAQGIVSDEDNNIWIASYDTVPSAGSQVLLHNGDPLYGSGSNTECYGPLMRQTNCVIDQAGNVWAINNWKPDFNTDFSPDTGNPGGDGIVIFVGLAKPPIKKH